MYIKVKVTPKSAKEKLEKKKDNYYLISVKEPAERNLANNRICQILALNFNVTKDKVRIISGHRSRNKMLSIDI